MSGKHQVDFTCFLFVLNEFSIKSRTINILLLGLNVLLVFIPVSWALHFAKKDDTVVFIFSFLAVIPLARLVAFATDDISMRVGETPANLINTSFRNTAVLIIAITALLKCELQIVQSSLVGSILNKILLTPGMCFFAGGIKYSEQGFGAAATQIDSSMLTISVIAVLLPAAFHLIVNLQGQNPSDAHENQEILKMSHGVAILLLISEYLYLYFHLVALTSCGGYLGYLIFQLYSHSTLYSDQAVSSKSTKYTDKKRMDEETGTVQSPNVTRTGIVNNSTFVHSLEEAEKEEMPQMSLLMALALLAVVTVLIAVTAEWLVDAITEMTVELEEMARTNSRIISRDFISIILLPIVGNAAEYVPAITVSVKDKLALSLGEAVASSIQTALSIIPCSHISFTVLIAWMMGKPLTLLFDPYESITLFLAGIFPQFFGVRMRWLLPTF
ncbi:hypothetical protein V5O48_017764 [Marasmius crinis-equi]|uniref:Sodium/calcium exchanger membrane region domain-containing protein n=1 Tax=Marasmius crinis-equi TaxID=585013 RepID=A0ABR3EN30_9AGAR